MLVNITDQLTDRRYLVDTGASYCLVPHKSTKPPAKEPRLIGPNGSLIRCWGEERRRLRFSGRTFEWTFLQADVAFPILGVDFLRNNKLMVDVASNTLVDSTTGDTFALSELPSGYTASVVLPGGVRGAKATPPGVVHQPSRREPAPQGAEREAASSPTYAAAAAAAAPRSLPTRKATPPGVVHQPPRRQAAPPGAVHERAATAVPRSISTPADAQMRSRGNQQPPKSIPALLELFQDVLNPGKELPHTSCDVAHFLSTKGPPIASAFRRLDPEKSETARKEFEDMEAAGVVRRSTSPWASPLHMVRKADGTWRLCGDYRRLNAVTVPDTYPIPNMMDFTARATGCTVFSKIDLKKGYQQIPMNPADIPKTAITTPFGLFEYTRMTFGMRNAGNTFQRLMDRVLSGEKSAFPYLDDILISSKNQEEHRHHLMAVLQRLQAAGLAANAEKCEFGKSELDFLGHRVSAAGIEPLPGRVQAIMDHPAPVTVKDMQNFLGVMNFYRRFVPAAAKTYRPLTEALRGSPRPNTPVVWTKEMRTAFQAAKETLRAATSLAFPRQQAELSLMVDASAEHVGAVLQQRASPAAPWEPLGFFSKKLDPAQTRYSAYDRELLACVSGIRHFRFMVEGRRFTLYTDHKPLTFALAKAAEPWTARQCRHLSYIAEFTSDIRHVAGAENVVADTLSRPPQAAAGTVAAVAASPESLDYTAIAEAQRDCPSIVAASDTSLSLKLVTFPGPVRVLCDTKGQQPRPVIPLGYRRRVFTAFHGQAHPGAKATRRLMSERVVWTRMGRDIKEWVADCQECARAKVTRQPAAAIQPIPVPQQRFSHIHIDIVGPLPVSKEGYRYLFTIIDRASRMLEAVPLTNVETATCRDALINNWIARFGVPAHLTSDQGAQFTSSLWARTCEVIGTHHNTTTAYHPQSNGMIERPHRRLKEALKARLAAADWPEHLPWVLLNMNVAPREDTGKSAAEMVYGTTLTLPAQLAAGEERPVEDILRALNSAEPIPTRHRDSTAPTELPSLLANADMVYLRKGGQLPPLAQPYLGPYKVVEKNPKYFRLDIGGKMQSVSVDRLKPHTGAAATTPAAPPRRGRPPAARTEPVPSPTHRDQSTGLPATAIARPARTRRPPNRLVL